MMSKGKPRHHFKVYVKTLGNTEYSLLGDTWAVSGKQAINQVRYRIREYLPWDTCNKEYKYELIGW